ncbi:hypothetical protein [Rhizobium sp. CCGE532]|uniref:hypothetical protein n=1 Tax=Rhizobium sp. CCGE532 TaxID=2364272 RepID=UPI001FE0B752|nr:hypothetical protein [Rhizobium sp. CCGE532]
MRSHQVRQVWGGNQIAERFRRILNRPDALWNENLLIHVMLHQKSESSKRSEQSKTQVACRMSAGGRTARLAPAGGQAL